MAKPPGYDAAIAALVTEFPAPAAFTRQEAATVTGLRVGEVDRVLRFARKSGLDNVGRDPSSGNWLFTE